MSQEFKINRLRYTWSGTWQASTSYIQDAVVNYKGKTYVCLVANTSNANFYNDLNAIPYPYWQLVLDGKTFLGPWLNGTSLYSLGNIVIFGGQSYYCTVQHTPTAFAADLASGYWSTYASFAGWSNVYPNWQINTAYGIKSIVVYGATVYQCNANHTSASSTSLGLENDQSKWTAIDSGLNFTGNWAPGVRYKANDLAKSGPDLYIANVGHTAGSTIDTTKWALWIPGYEYLGTWSSGANYQPGDTIEYGGYTYVSQTANNSGNVPSAGGSSYWTILTAGYNFRGEWTNANSPSPYYKVGDVVRRHGSVFVASADSTGQDPISYLTSTTYTAAGSSGVTLKVASTSSIKAGMTVIGTGFTAGQTVRAVVDNTTLTLGTAPDGSLTDGQSLSFIGYNYVYWNIVVKGIFWTKTWVSGTAYIPGDLAVWQNGTYVCIQQHGATTSNRPDADTTNTYWVFYIPHSRKNALNTVGDIETYRAGGYSAIPIGTQQYVLKNISGTPTWTKINVVPQVYYVANSGTNSPTYGTSWDQPFRTIAYACNFIGAGTQYTKTAAILTANKTFAITEMYNWMLYQKQQGTNGFSSSSVFDQAKTYRDADYLIDAVIYDITRNGNSQTVAATLAYFAFGSQNQLFNASVQSEIVYFYQSINFLSNLLTTYIIPQLAVVSNYQSLMSATTVVSQVTTLPAYEQPGFDAGYTVSGATQIQTLMNIVYNALYTQSTSQVPVPNSGITATIMVKTGLYLETLPITVPENVAIVGDELRSVVVQPAISITTTATATTTGTNLITVASTAGLTDQMPVQFVDPTISTSVVWSAYGGLTAGQTYYVIGSSITATQFSVALSPTVAFFGTTISGSTTIKDISGYSGIAVGATLTGSGIPVGTTITAINLSSLSTSDASSTITISAAATSSLTRASLTSTGATAQLTSYTSGGYASLSMTVYAGDCLKDMFRLRNGTGLRNMTLNGLLGTLGAPDAYQIQRPTGGSFACLDPGYGPWDTTAWIFRRSPYVQNVTAFGNGCAGLKIDGTLHNGGNKSIVCNDFTHIVNDGIGIWCTGPSALTEAVSVFSYYGYVGYMADAGGRIRATNGNTSYGSYGVISTGYDSTEAPATGIIFNRSTQVQANVQQSYGSNSQILKLQYANAGSNYTSTTTNLLNYSNNFQGASWNADGNVVFSKVNIAPTGLTEAWTLLGLTGGPDGAYISQNIAIPTSGAVFNGVTPLNSIGTNQSGVTFNVTVTALAYSIVIANPGTGYVQNSSQVYIPGSQLGGVNSVNDCIINITGTGAGGSVTSAVVVTSLNGATVSVVPTNSAFPYTFSVYVKAGTASSIDLSAIYSGNKTITSRINYVFSTNAVTPSSLNGGLTPINYGAISQQVSSTSSTAGWYRLWFSTYDTTGLNTQLQFKINVRGYNGTANTYTYLYGSQVEISKSTYTPSFYLEVLTQSKYTAYANYNITGSGTGAVAIGDESRSQGVFQSYVTADSNGVTGGAGFLTASNNAQSGTDQFVQLAASDTNLNANYTGMRVFINSGTGAGQYGYISYYNSSATGVNSKTAWVLKESFTPLTISSTTASGSNIFTLSNQTTDSMYDNMPIQFIPTYYTTNVTSVGLSQTTASAATGTVNGIAINTLTVASTAGLYYNAPLTFTVNSGNPFTNVLTNYIYYVVSIVDSTTIQISSSAYGTVYPLNTATGSLVVNFPSNTSYLQGSTTNMVVNYPIAFTGTALGGITVGSTYYIQDIIDGSNFTISSSLLSVPVSTTTSGTNTLTVTSPSTATALVPLNPIVFTNVMDNITANTKYYITQVVDTQNFQVSSSLLKTTITIASGTSGTAAPAFSPGGYQFVASSVTGFVTNQPIKFVGTAFGGVTSETLYYISTVDYVNNYFTISQFAGGNAVQTQYATGSMYAITCPAPVTLTGASGSMTGSTTGVKISLGLQIGTMNGTFSTSLFGNPVLGTTYYVIGSTLTPSGNTFKVASLSGSTSALVLVTQSGSMNVAAGGWDHINPGTPIQSVIDNTSAYYIEPRPVYGAPSFYQFGATSTYNIANGSYYSSMSYGNGTWMAVPSANSVGAISTDGQNWSSAALPGSANWSGVAYGNTYWVIIASSTYTVNGTIYQSAVSKANGAGWTNVTMPSQSPWSYLAYGNGIFVALATTSATRPAYSTNYGNSWSSAATLLPGSSITYSGVCYGNGTFVAISSGSTQAAYSLDGSTWVSSTLPSNTTWSSVAYGNGVFVAISSSTSVAAYSVDGITWLASKLTLSGTSIAYGQGVFSVLNSNANGVCYTSEDGQNWIKRSVLASAYSAQAFGFDASANGKFVNLFGNAGGSYINAGCKTKGRATISSGSITSINEFEPGSGYGASPTVTFTDPNVTTLAVITARVSNGVLGSPSLFNRGNGYSTSSTSVTITGNGYSDQYQTGLTVILNNLTKLPSPGDNLTIAGVSQVYKVTSAYSVYSTSIPNLEANVSVSPAITTANATANGTIVSIRSKYSQARLTNHDFLNIGYGDQLNSNYPGYPLAGYTAIANNQTVEVNYGRVFFTSTDQDGNFKVGNLFGVAQATGIVTLSASQFGLTGLSSLSLGGIAVGSSSVQITQFSTDASFTANSDSIIPTQKAIKSYISSRLSQGGSNTFTGQLTAGTVVVGGATFIRSSVPSGVSGSRVRMTSKVNIAGASAGVDGNMAALDFFMRNGVHRS